MLRRFSKQALVYPILTSLLLPFIDVWKGIVLLLLTVVHVVTHPFWEEREKLERERFYLPLNLLLFSFLCKVGLPLPRALQFMDKNLEKGLLWKVVNKSLCYTFRGYTINYMVRELNGVEKELGNLLIDAWSMSKTEHPYSILRAGGKGYKGKLIEKVETFESKRALSKALSFFLPILITPLVSPRFLLEDVLFTVLLALMLYKMTSYL